MRRKRATLLIAALALAIVMAGCASGSRPIGDYWFSHHDETASQDEAQDAAGGDAEQPNSYPQEDGATIPAYTPPNDAVTPEVIAYSDSYKKKAKTELRADIISFPSTVVPEGDFVQELFTEAEFKSVLQKYSDLQNNDNDELVIKPKTFAYRHEQETIVNQGENVRIFFFGATYLDAQQQLAIHEINYDAEGKTIYIILDESKDTHSSVELFQPDVAAEIEAHSKTTYGILVLPADDYYDTDSIDAIIIVKPASTVGREKAALKEIEKAEKEAAEKAAQESESITPTTDTEIGSEETGD